MTMLESTNTNNQEKKEFVKSPLENTEQNEITQEEFLNWLDN